MAVKISSGGQQLADRIPERAGTQPDGSVLSPRERVIEEALKVAAPSDEKRVTYVATAANYMVPIFATRPVVIDGRVIDGRNRLAKFENGTFSIDDSDPDFSDAVKALDKHPSFGKYYYRAESLLAESRAARKAAAEAQLRAMATDPELAGVLKAQVGESAFDRLARQAQAPEQAQH